MAESHVISGLVSKCSELSGQRDYYQEQINELDRDIATLHGAIKVLDSDYDLRTIKGKQHRQKNSFFKMGEGNRLLMDRLREAGGPVTTTELVEQSAQVKGYDLTQIDRRAFTASLFTILKRLQSNGIVEEVGRKDNVIIWKLAA